MIEDLKHINNLINYLLNQQEDDIVRTGSIMLGNEEADNMYGITGYNSLLYVIKPVCQDEIVCFTGRLINYDYQGTHDMLDCIPDHRYEILNEKYFTKLTPNILQKICINEGFKDVVEFLRHIGLK